MSIQIVFFCNPIPLIIFNTVDAIVSPMIDCCGIEEIGILYSFSSRSLVPVPLLNFHKLVEVKVSLFSFVDNGDINHLS